MLVTKVGETKNFQSQLPKNEIQNSIYNEINYYKLYILLLRQNRQLSNGKFYL